MQKINHLIIFGCGGVGSWVANFATRARLCDKISLVDFDKVEEKNLFRQNYSYGQINDLKVHACKDNVDSYSPDYTPINVYNRKILDEIDMANFDKDAIAIVATDNVNSKRLIAKHFRRFLLVNCDKDFVEIKNYLDETDTKAWDLGGGYSNAQDIISNIYSSICVFYLLKENVGLLLDDLPFNIRQKPDTMFGESIKVVEPVEVK